MDHEAAEPALLPCPSPQSSPAANHKDKKKRKKEAVAAELAPSPSPQSSPPTNHKDKKEKKKKDKKLGPFRRRHKSKEPEEEEEARSRSSTRSGHISQLLKKSDFQHSMLGVPRPLYGTGASFSDWSDESGENMESEQDFVDKLVHPTPVRADQPSVPGAPPLASTLGYRPSLQQVGHAPFSETGACLAVGGCGSPRWCWAHFLFVLVSCGDAPPPPPAQAKAPTLNGQPSMPTLHYTVSVTLQSGHGLAVRDRTGEGGGGWYWWGRGEAGEGGEAGTGGERLVRGGEAGRVQLHWWGEAGRVRLYTPMKGVWPHLVAVCRVWSPSVLCERVAIIKLCIHPPLSNDYLCHPLPPSLPPSPLSPCREQ